MVRRESGLSLTQKQISMKVFKKVTQFKTYPDYIDQLQYVPACTTSLWCDVAHVVGDNQRHQK